MNWKVFTTAFISAALMAVPQNSFTCGATEDPYDYYTSFFSNSAASDNVYRPFYYTSLLSFYDDYNPDTAHYANDKVIKEWMAYTQTTKLNDAVELIYNSSLRTVSQLVKSVDGGSALPDSLRNNSLAATLVKDKKGDAIRYLGFAKKTAALSPVSQWEEAPKPDRQQVEKTTAEATSLFTKSTDPFLKNKYAFQRCKIAFYDHDYAGCIQLYDEYFNESNTSAVKELALSYKAGSLYRTGNKKEAAYLFAKLFASSPQAKKQNYLGFWRASNNADTTLIADYTSLCKNNSERANMLGMFAMYGVQYKLNDMQKVYALNPASPLLPLLAAREIHKLEEQYFSPILANEKGGKALYVNYDDWQGRDENGKPKIPGKTQAIKTAQFFEKLFADKALAGRAFYGVGAAYLHFINKEYPAASALLANIKEAQPSAKVKDQAQLINLLIAANSPQTISKEREASLLSSMKWLVHKAAEDEEYRLFCRNFFSEIMAQKYEQQGDLQRAAFAYGLADLSFIKRGPDVSYYSSSTAIDFVRKELNTGALLKLYEVMTEPQTETEKFFVQNASFKRDDAIDVIGTSYLRDRSYAKAIEWLSKAKKLDPLVETQYNYKTDKEKKINIDPLHDYLNDWQRYNKSAPAAYTKLSLAKKLLELQSKMQSDTVTDKAKLYYTYASALYNMSQYGNSWSAVAWYRSSGDWNIGSYKLPWLKEYYGVYEARNFYQKAYDAATSKEYKAACLFMIIKCAQRQVVMPPYDYKNDAASTKAVEEFERRFKYNPLFAKLKSDFGNTKFYQYAYNRCSYLRDYVKRSGSATSSTSNKNKK